MPGAMIDWVVAEWIAARIAGTPRDAEPVLRGVDLDALAEDAQRRVLAYTGLRLSVPVPAPEAVDRREWARANIASTRTLIDPLLQSAAGRLGPARGPGRLWLEAVSSAEIGVMLGFLAQRVLGQYELILLDEYAEGRQPRLLFVAPNLAEAVRRFNADPQEFVTWVTLHEVTHAVQFGGVPWLREYLAEQIRELLRSAEQRIERPRRLALPSLERITDVTRAVLRADLVGIVTSERERELLDRAQAVMAVVEGHAEHVMDAVAPELLPSLPRLRGALDRRRREQRGIARYLNRLLGFEMKLRQYAQGKAFCDRVVELGGKDALHHVFSSPQALPTLAELEAPELWLARTWQPG